MNLTSKVLLVLTSMLLLVHTAPVAEMQGRNPTPQCDPGEDTCSTCYDLLANEVIVSDKNRYNLQQAFFPADRANPVFVAVTYHFIRNPNGTTNYSAEGPEQHWFWTQSTFYLFQPLDSLQFTSLLFSDTAFSSSQVNLYLQPSCNESTTPMMQLLTQRVSAK